MISTTETGKVYNVLFLCTGNSARSVMAEAIVDRLGQNSAKGWRFKGFSAGSHPTGRVNPYALDLLRSLGHPTDGLRSKTWDEFALPGAPQMDFVITVCDNAAGEVCPVWPGQPVTAHWPFRDPAAAEGTEAEKRQVFADVYGQIHNRVDIFVNLPIDALDRLSLQQRLRNIGAGDMGASRAESA